MRIYLNAGHDIETASQVMTKIESSRGMAEVSMTVSGPQPTLKSTPVKWEGVSFINNCAYTNEGVLVWRAYGVDYGKFLPWNTFRQQCSSPLPQLNKHTDNVIFNVSFQTVSVSNKKERHRKIILLKYSKRENAPDKRLILLTVRRQCEELSTVMVLVFG